MAFPQQRSSGRRAFLSGSLFGLGALSTSLPAVHSEESQSARRTALFPKDVNAAAPGYSPGIVAEGRRIVVVSGQGPDDLSADIETQIRQTFQRIGKVLAEAGATFDHVVLLRAYFLQLKRDLPAYRKVRLEFLKNPYPASTSVGTTELAVSRLEFEIEAVAVI